MNLKSKPIMKLIKHIFLISLNKLCLARWTIPILLSTDWFK